MSAQPETLKQSYNDVVEATSYDVLIDMIKAGYETIAAQANILNPFPGDCNDYCRLSKK
jgi:hypothetical protein